jgi:hypothetical protein
MLGLIYCKQKYFFTRGKYSFEFRIDVLNVAFLNEHYATALLYSTLHVLCC